MAHEIETAFYTKEPAWHGLGTVVAEAPTSEEALHLAGLDWEVEKAPIFLKEGAEFIEQEDKVALRRTSDNSVLGYASPDYTIWQNREAFAFADALLNNNDGVPVTFESAGSLRGGKRIWLLAHLPSKLILGDEVANYVVIHSSHDTNYAPGAAMTPTRVVCMNTLTAALRDAPRQWKTRHTGDLQSRVKEAQRTLNMANAYMDSFEAFAENLQQKQINARQLDDIIELVFPILPDEGPVRKDNVMALRSQFMDVFNNAMSTDLQAFRGDAWGVYNAFGDFATHITPKRERANFKEELWTSFIDGNKMLNSAQAAILKVAA